MNFFDYVLDLLFPPSCVCCGELLKIGSPLPFCDKCHRIVKEERRNYSKDLKNQIVDRCYCIYSYRSDEVKSMVFHVKNTFSKKYAVYFREDAKESLTSHNLIDKIEVITFIPRDRGQIKSIGFDQAEIMAKELSKATGIACTPLLKRVKRGVAQKTLNAEKRQENVSGIFQVLSDVKGKRVLLTDDVVTTGATVTEAAKMLKRQGAEKVFVLSLAD